jgi:hypothetical protein
MLGKQLLMERRSPFPEANTNSSPLSLDLPLDLWLEKWA